MSTSTLRLTHRASDRIRAGHLWVYRTDIDTRGAQASQPQPAPGGLVTLTDSRGVPLGTALYSSTSMLAARLVSPIPALTRDQYLADLRTRIAAALELRRELAPVTPDNNAYRLIFSEADNLPGIVADVYNNLILLQLLTQGTAQDDVRRTVVDALRAGLGSDGEIPGTLTGGLTIWERPDPRIRELESLAPPPAGPLFTTDQAGFHLDPSVAGASSAVPPQNEGARPASILASGDNVLAPATTTFSLNGLRFHYDAASGQKTGAFLDQRLNYAAAARAVEVAARANPRFTANSVAGFEGGIRGLRGLDICTYQGGFALHLAQVCARVTGVDASRSALEAADRNLLLNPELSAACEIEWIEADAFEYLRHLDGLARAAKPGVASARNVRATAAGWRDGHADRANPHLFDAVVLDPPAFAKSKRAAESALRGYKELNLRALRILAPGGTLITCSCSHHVSLADFTAIVAAAAADAGRRVQLLETRAAAPDHPEVLTVPETRYLKCLICRIG